MNLRKLPEKKKKSVMSKNTIKNRGQRKTNITTRDPPPDISRILHQRHSTIYEPTHFLHQEIDKNRPNNHVKDWEQLSFSHYMC